MIAARLLMGVVLAVAAAVAGTAAAEPSGGAPALAAINMVRAEAGLAPVRFEARLACAAEAHARDIAARGTLDHAGADGAGLGARLLRAGYRFARAAENLAGAEPGPEDVATLWHESRGHRRNMLNPAMTEAGIARVLAADGTYWVLVLAAPAPPAGQIGGNPRFSSHCEMKSGMTGR